MEAEVGGVLAEMIKSFLPIFTQSGFETGRRRERGKGLNFVGLDLIGQKKVDNVVNIRDRSCKNSQGVGFFVKMGGAATGRTANLRPGTHIGKAGFGKDFRTLTDDDGFGLVDLGRETSQRVGKSVEGVKKRFHFNISVFEGIDGDFLVGLESRAVGADMEFDGRD